MFSKSAIVSIEVTPLEARFDRHFGGADQIPTHILAPASHFQAFPRTGQYSVLVKVALADGSHGYGEAFGLPHPAPTAAFLKHVVSPALTGRCFSGPEASLSDLVHFLGALGEVHGVAAQALSAVDIALWDLAARRAGVALSDMLGGTARRLPTYASPIPMMASPEQTEAQARGLITQGYRAVKLKIGRGVGVDVAHVDAARRGIGAECALMVDVNCAYGFDDALTLCRELATFGLAWIEEPLASHCVARLPELAALSTIPLAAGENLFDFDSFERLAAAGAVAFLQPNISRAGGVSGLRRLDALCARHGILLAPHGVGGAVAVAAGLSVSAASRAFAWYEANLLPNALRDELAGPAPVLVDGRLAPRQGPGHGAEPLAALVASYRWIPKDRPHD